MHLFFKGIREDLLTKHTDSVMKHDHWFARATPEKAADPKMDGTSFRFESMEHGGVSRHHAQAIKLVDAEPLLHLCPDPCKDG